MRLAAVLRYQRLFGWDEDTAALPALALYPFGDSDPSPASREFTKAVRKRSRAFARFGRRAAPDELLAEAAEAIRFYRQVAVQEGELEYADRFRRILANEPPA